jgi:UPF0271 protein
MQQLLAAGLVMMEPSPRARARVEHVADGLGEADRLSGADVDVLALAMDLGVPCLTDDYSVQNVAAVLGIEARPFREGGIRAVWRWGVRCPGCRRRFEEGRARPGDPCPVCGTELRTSRRR